MYSNCDCDPSKYTQDASCSLVNEKTGPDEVPSCWIKGHNKTKDLWENGIWLGWGYSRKYYEYNCKKISDNFSGFGVPAENTLNIPALVHSSNDTCKNRAGEILYPDDCDCNEQYFNAAENCKYYDGNWNSDWVEFGAYCKKRNGTILCHPNYIYHK